MTVYPSTYRKRLYGGNTGLTGPDITLLGVLAHLAGNARDDGWFTVTQKELAQRGCIGMRTIQRQMPLLALAGWVEMRETARNGHYSATAYRLTLPPQAATQAHGEAATQAHCKPPESDPEAATQAQQVLRSKYLRESDSQRPTAAKNPTTLNPEVETSPNPPRPVNGDGPGDWRNPPPRIPNTSQLLKDLGIRSRRRP